MGICRSTCRSHRIEESSPDRVYAVALSGKLGNIPPPRHQGDFGDDRRSLRSGLSVRDDDDRASKLVGARNIAGQPMGVIHERESPRWNFRAGDPLLENKAAAISLFFQVLHHIVCSHVTTSDTAARERNWYIALGAYEQCCTRRIRQGRRQNEQDYR
jgi:hypothetical protein